MKKTIIAAAVAASVAAPAAFADVTVYGKIHQSMDNFDLGDVSSTYSNTAVGNNASIGDLVIDGTTFGDVSVDGLVAAQGTAVVTDAGDQKSMNSNASRIGVKGSEDLGNGMSAFFKMEYGTGVTDNGTALTNRDAIVGIDTGAGKVMLGRMGAPTKAALYGSVNVQVADSSAGNDHASMFLSKADRVNNALAYQNKFGAATVTLAVTGNDDDDHAANKSAGVAFDMGAGLSATAAVLDSEGTGKDTQLAGLKYSVDGLTVGVVYEKATNDAVTDFRDIEIDTLTDVAAPAAAEGDFKSWGVSASYTMGSNVISVSYADQNADFVGADANAEVDTKRTEVSFQHKLSKRTSLYATYLSADQDISAVGTTVATESLAAEAELRNFGLGVVHSF